jgi:small subunit ribosomal protein S12e
MEIENTETVNVEVKELTRESAIQLVIQRALNVNGVLKGIAETIKALENGKVKLVFLADDCDNEQYKETLTALANQYKVRIVSVGTWEELKDFCKLGMLSSTIRKIAEDKGKDPKIKPRCSCACIVDFGEEHREAMDFLSKN